MSWEKAQPVPPAPDIATKAELDRRIHNRARPAPEPHLTPDGPDTTAVNRQVNDMNESRICDLQQRLQVMREGADRDYSFAQMQDRAKADFECGR